MVQVTNSHINIISFQCKLKVYIKIMIDNICYFLIVYTLVFFYTIMILIYYTSAF